MDPTNVALAGFFPVIFLASAALALAAAEACAKCSSLNGLQPMPTSWLRSSVALPKCNSRLLRARGGFADSCKFLVGAAHPDKQTIAVAAAAAGGHRWPPAGRPS